MGRFQSIKSAVKGSSEQKEKRLLARLIHEYEQELFKEDLPDLNPVDPL